MRLTQKFKRGDVVRIAKDLGPHMAHFENDRDAVIIGSYRDQYGGDNIDSWTVMFCDTGYRVSWYETQQLTFIKNIGEDGIEAILVAKSKREDVEKDFDWIVANWIGIRENPSGATMAKLMSLVGITNPWGRNGEGFVYHANMMATYKLLDPVLSTGRQERRRIVSRQAIARETPANLNRDQ